MAVSTGAAGGTSDLEFINCYLNSDSDLMDSVKCDCLLSHSGIVQNEITGNDLFCYCLLYTSDAADESLV